MSLPLEPPVPVVSNLADGPENRMEGVWPDRVITAVTRPELHSFFCRDARAAALVFAGGGYTSLMYDKEGTEVALWLNGLGIDAHVVVHRLPGGQGPQGVFPKDIALADSLAAFGLVDDFSSGRLMLLVGLSSGGHLAGVMACQELTPSPVGAIITYAPLNANHRAHKVPAGKPDYTPVQKQDFYDDWPVGLAGYTHAMPRVPLFLAYALNDTAVPVDHALRLIQSSAPRGLDVDAHIFGRAPHGFALRERNGTHAAWTELAEDWIDRQLAAAAP